MLGQSSSVLAGAVAPYGHDGLGDGADNTRTGLWGEAAHTKVFNALTKALHGGKPFSFNEAFYGPAMLPISSSQAALLANWLMDCVEQAASTAPAAQRTREWVPKTSAALIEGAELHQLAFTMASIKAYWINHYRLCKPLAYQTFPPQTAEALIESDTLPMLQELATSVCLLHRCTVGLLGWPQALWRVLLHWICLTTPVLYGLGYHESVTHGAQVARWCVLSAQLKAPGDIWLQLQAAMVGWFHDPKLHVRLSIDNVATHPILASIMARHNLMHPWMHNVFYDAWRQHPPQTLGATLSGVGVPDKLVEVYQSIEEALAINSDSRFVMDTFIVPAIQRRLPTQELQDELTTFLNHWHDSADVGFVGEKMGALKSAVSEPLWEALSETTLYSGLLAIKNESWAQAYQWLKATRGIGDGVSAERFYQRVLQGQVDTHDAVQSMQHWMRQAELMEETPFVKWAIPATLLLTHHQRVCNPVLAECLAAADPLMLSPHKILQARPVEEPLVQRVKSYLASLQDNMQDILDDNRLPKGMVDGWHRQVLMLLVRVATRFNPQAALGGIHAERSLAEWHEVLSKPETWGSVAWVDDCTEKGTCLIEHMTDTLKTEFDEAEYHYLVASLQGA